MEWLNYHHLLYFWVAAREGSVTRAGEVLHLSQPTVSGQIKELEKSLGVELFARAGRGRVLTDTGQAVFRYADEIFSLGRELTDMVRGRPPGRPLRLRVGIVDVMPKLIVHKLLEPALRLPERVRVACVEGKLDRLTAELTVHDLDVVLSDAPVPLTVKARVFDHLLGECGVVVVGAKALAERYRPGFPRSLTGAPFLLPSQNTSVRRALDQWFDARGVRPEVVGEFDDSALLKIFGRAGEGLFAVSAAIEKEVRRQYGVARVGRVPEVVERFYAVSVERKLKHPAVVAISDAARRKLFG